MTAALAGRPVDLKDRLRAAFHTRLDILRGDRKLPSALFRYIGEPQHPRFYVIDSTLFNAMVIGIFLDMKTYIAPRPKTIFGPHSSRAAVEQ